MGLRILSLLWKTIIVLNVIFSVYILYVQRADLDSYDARVSSLIQSEEEREIEFNSLKNKYSTLQLNYQNLEHRLNEPRLNNQYSDYHSEEAGAHDSVEVLSYQQSYQQNHNTDTPYMNDREDDRGYLDSGELSPCEKAKRGAITLVYTGNGDLIHELCDE